MAKKKPATKAEREHLDKVASLGCIACFNKGMGYVEAEVHHITTGVGMGQRASHYETIPLCPPHHRTGPHSVAIHAGKQTWEGIHGTELELLAQVRGML